MQWLKRLEEIASDSVHGATYLTKALMHVALEADDMDLFFKKSAKLHPLMASIYNFLHDLKAALEAGEEKERFCLQWWERFVADHQRVVHEAATLIEGKRVLVHSFSSAVFEAICEADVVHVIATESRPKGEGISLAKRLFAQKRSVELIIDAAAPYRLQEVDMVLFGADGVGSFGVVHKVGSLGIALACDYFHKPLYALAHPKKFWPNGFRLPQEPPKDPDEICSCEVPRSNIYFDVTPLALFRQIIH